MYITPRVLIQQEFLQLPVYSEFPLPAFIIGPNYSLRRYSLAAEKPLTMLGSLDGSAVLTGNSYNTVADTRYDIPNIQPGGEVDHSYTKVFAEAVEARYFPLTALGDAGVNAADVEFITTPKGGNYPNRVHFTGVTLKTSNGYNRDAVFSNRDVAVNDIIEVSDDLGNTVKAKISAVLAETSAINGSLASEIAPEFYSGVDGVTNGTSVFTSASANFEASEVVGKYITIRHILDTPGVFKILSCVNSHTLILDKSAGSASSRVWYIDGVYNGTANTPWECVEYGNSPVSVGSSNATVTAVNSSSAYVGYAAKRILTDVYTVTVTSGTTTSNARFSIASQNGAFSLKENAAIDGGYLVLDEENNNYVRLSFTAAEEGGTIAFVAGNSWTVSLIAEVNPVNPVVAGTYTGPTDMTYKITVERGGAFYDGSNALTAARLVITASNLDTSTVILPRFEEAFNIGSYGVTAAFEDIVNNGGLIAGDVYYVPVVAAKLGPVTVVEFDESMPESMLSLASTLTAKLSLTQKSISIPEIRDLLTDDRNWTQEYSYITINEGITTYDTKLVTGNDPARLPVVSAKLFVEHRDLLQDNVNAIDSVRSLADVSTKLGVIHPDNPLAQGVYDAVLNAANQVVYFIGVQSDDLLGYNEAIKISEKSDKVYSFVPMTFDRTIQDAVVAHVNAYSTPEVGRWRIAWISVQDQKTHEMYNLKEDGLPYQATITDDPLVSGTQVKLVTIEGAKFVEDVVRPNDTIRINYRLNADGKEIYDEYVVDQVRTNTTLTITKAVAAPISLPVKVAVIRNYTKSERANNIAHIGGDFNNRRVRCVFPDTFKYGGVTKQGYFAAAGLAGLRSGVVPHQGLTNTEYLGADDLSKIVIEFSQDDLNTMAEQGIWLITQEVIGATPYVRHQLTTDESSLNTSEDSITTNVDNISYALKKTLSPFIGRYNVNKENVNVVRDAVAAELRFRAVDTYTARAGNQLVSFTPATDIVRIEQNATYKDRIDVEVILHVPYPMNYISLKLIVG
jgi:hypothetical protein